ncbi:hypothetical protein CWE09_10465 [Aliidiomarina minuta]|uniref:Uncharacterized protein n=1 Tax=Aliidiomarina minuta TaxID=880057 RepID=A0A432W467_9GAMM|nr:DUF6776 family protein [Aliidiomarina minuta]RUO24292.1 hypothetical protein CWE09_10465 [Aliidiomarina minuta]
MSFSKMRQRTGRLKFTLTVAAVAAVCIWLGYILGNARLSWLEGQYASQQDRIQRLQQTIEQLEYRINILQVELDVERVATTTLQQDLRSAQSEKSGVRRELAFYQRVMAPELDAEGVTIDSLVVSPSGPGIYHFRLILVQIERAQQQLAQGSVSITLRGREQGSPKELDLFELANKDDSARTFAMNYFTRLDGSFKLPAEIEPESIVVQVRTRTGGRTERRFQWGDLIDLVDESE